MDEQVARRDPQVEDLMSRFVCVRVVQANTLDLELFQFDYDLTFAVLFMNADRTIYGRFGSRSNEHSTDDLSMDGLREALAGALELHRGYPANRDSLAGKQGRPVRFKRPEDYPSLRGKFKPDLDYAGSVARSCMHCHQVRDAERLTYREARKPVPDQVLYPYPLPEVVGLKLDPKTKARVTSVAAGSAAEHAGFQPGDEFHTLNGQPILSVADVQWVLQHVGRPADQSGPAKDASTATIAARVVRDGKKKSLTLELPEGWRRASDLAWRVTTWDLRRMATGGLLLEQLPADARRDSGLADTDLALRVKHVGEYGEHAAAKRAGFQKGDVITEFDGRSGRLTETDVLAFGVQNKLPGEQIRVTVLREGKRLELKLPVQ